MNQFCLRAAVANGYAHLGKYGYTKYAADMEVMMWHCQAEERVIKIAAKCKGMHTSLTVPYGYKMNTILVENKGQSEDQIIEEALGKWRNQLTTVDTLGDYTADMDNKIAQATKMIWHSNNKVACAYSKCKDTKYYGVACLYAQGGNEVGKPIYTKEDEWAFICTSCPTGTKCDHETDKLCYPEWALGGN
ncbi:hypothetical protein Q1695_007875 [Nippostrongylus brasiliensis]|nr:hypothetical protein Q1695_007875 [Nippostrongylus brasiliensis]